MCLIIWVEPMDPWSDGVRPVAGAQLRQQSPVSLFVPSC